MKNRKPRPQVEKRIDGISGGSAYTLKPAKEGYYFGGNWTNLLGGVFIDKGTANSANSLAVDNLGALRLLPATKSTLGGVKAGKNVSIQQDGTLDVEATGSGGGLPPYQITVQGYKAYALEFLRVGASSAFSNLSFSFGQKWSPVFKTYKEINGNFYCYHANTEYKFEKLYLSKSLEGYYAVYGLTNETNQIQISTSNFTNYEDWNGIGLFFCVDVIAPPGTSPFGIMYEYGYASLILYYLYKYNNSQYSAVSISGYPFLVPFASAEEYEAATGKEVT